MKHISPYIDQNDLISSINESLIGKEMMIANAISYESILNEASYLDKIESLIPDELSFQIQLDIILEKGARALTGYFNNLHSSNYIKEQFDVSSTDVASAMSQYNQLDWNNVMGNIKSTTDVKTANTKPPAIKDDSILDGEFDTSGGMLGMLKSLGNSLTEGGSPIGILHLVLDIVGLVGDAFGPVGLIADVINGIIYLMRGKWLLALISFIGAMIPFGGNILKGMFQASKTGKQVSKMSAVYFGKGSAKMTDEAIELAAAASPKSIKAINYIAKSSRKALPMVGNFIGKFFNDFLGKIVGWIPILGKPLKKLFANISSIFSNFQRKALRLADDMPLVMSKREAKVLNNFFEASNKRGSRIVAQGDTLVVRGTGGKIISELPANMLKGSDALVGRYGKGIASDMSKAHMNVAQFYEGIAKSIGQVSKVYGRANKIGMSVIIVNKKIPLFIGKEVIKIMSPGKGGSKYTEHETEAIGNAAIQTSMQDRIDRDLKENPKASYSVPYVDALKDNKTQKVLQKAQRDYATKFNMVGIADVVYAKNARKDKLPEDVQEWYNKTWEDKQGHLDSMEIDLFENKMSESMKHVIPFNKF